MKPGDFVVMWNGYPRPAAYYGVVRAIDGDQVTVWEEFRGKQDVWKLGTWTVVDSDKIPASSLEKLKRAAGQESDGQPRP